LHRQLLANIHYLQNLIAVIDLLFLILSFYSIPIRQIQVYRFHSITRYKKPQANKGLRFRYWLKKTTSCAGGSKKL